MEVGKHYCSDPEKQNNSNDLDYSGGNKNEQNGLDSGHISEGKNITRKIFDERIEMKDNSQMNERKKEEYKLTSL